MEGADWRISGWSQTHFASGEAFVLKNVRPCPSLPYPKRRAREWKAVVPMMQRLWPFQGARAVRPSYRGVFVEQRPPRGGLGHLQVWTMWTRGEKETFLGRLSEAATISLGFFFITNEEAQNSQLANSMLFELFLHTQTQRNLFSHAGRLHVKHSLHGARQQHLQSLICDEPMEPWPTFLPLLMRPQWPHWRSDLRHAGILILPCLAEEVLCGPSANALAPQQVYTGHLPVTSPVWTLHTHTSLSAPGTTYIYSFFFF